jgi:hypothetical protein
LVSLACVRCGSRDSRSQPGLLVRYFSCLDEWKDGTADPTNIRGHQGIILTMRSNAKHTIAGWIIPECHNESGDGS